MNDETATRDQLRVHIRWMIRRDMPEVLAIEQASFEYPWSEDEFLRCLRQRPVIGMVAEHRERVVGYMVYELRKHSLGMLNFAVAPDSRHAGVGRTMAHKLFSKLSSHRRAYVTADVRENNLPAHLFFRACGFRCERVLRGFYEDSGEDAYRFAYRVTGE